MNKNNTHTECTFNEEEMAYDKPERLDLSTAVPLSEFLAQRQAQREMSTKHYKPIKKAVTMRLDSILIEYYKNLASAQGIGYQTLINATLNKVMQEQLKNAQ